MAAITGTGSDRQPQDAFWNTLAMPWARSLRTPNDGSLPAIAPRSRPAQNARPLPDSTTTRTSPRVARAADASLSALNMWLSSALSLSGRFSLTSAIASATLMETRSFVIKTKLPGPALARGDEQRLGDGAAAADGVRQRALGQADAVMPRVRRRGQPDPFTDRVAVQVHGHPGRDEPPVAHALGRAEPVGGVGDHGEPGQAVKRPTGDQRDPQPRPHVSGPGGAPEAAGHHPPLGRPAVPPRAVVVEIPLRLRLGEIDRHLDSSRATRATRVVYVVRLRAGRGQVPHPGRGHRPV